MRRPVASTPRVPKAGTRASTPPKSLPRNGAPSTTTATVPMAATMIADAPRRPSGDDRRGGQQRRRAEDREGQVSEADEPAGDDRRVAGQAGQLQRCPGHDVEDQHHCGGPRHGASRAERVSSPRTGEREPGERRTGQADGGQQRQHRLARLPPRQQVRQVRRGWSRCRGDRHDVGEAEHP